MATSLELHQAEAAAAVAAARAEGDRAGYDRAVAEFFGQNASFLLANIFADALEGAAGRLTTHDVGFAEQMHTFAQMLRGAVQQPHVTSASPKAGTTAVGGSLIVKFTQDMDPALMTEENFSVVADTTPVAFTVAYDAPSRTATLTPTDPYVSGATVTVTVAQVVKNTQGVAMAAPFAWSFTAA